MLAACFAIVLYHNAAETSVLNGAETKRRLAASTSYGVLRDTVLAPYLMRAVTERYPNNKLVDTQLVRETLKDTVSTQDMQRRFEPVVDATYSWLDSKASDIQYSVSFADKQDTFYKVFEKKIAKKIAALPVCDTAVYPPEDAVLEKTCIPSYVTPGEATNALMGNVRSTPLPIATISNDTFPLEPGLKSRLDTLPRYANYLWALNLLAIGVAIFGVVAVIWSRRSLGIMALGIALLLAGGAILFGQAAAVQAVTSGFGNDPMIQSVKNALLPPFTTAVNWRAITSVVVGIVLIALAAAWRWRQKSANA